MDFFFVFFKTGIFNLSFLCKLHVIWFKKYLSSTLLQISSWILTNGLYTWDPSAIYSDSIQPLSVLHWRKKTWVVAYFFNFLWTKIFLNFFYKCLNMQLSSGEAITFQKKYFCWKNHPKKLLRIPQIHFFPLLPWLPKRPKQKNSCSKMWPIDQLYIELGLGLH